MVNITENDQYDYENSDYELSDYEDESPEEQKEHSFDFFNSFIRVNPYNEQCSLYEAQIDDFIPYIKNIERDNTRVKQIARDSNQRTIRMLERRFRRYSEQQQHFQVTFSVFRDQNGKIRLIDGQNVILALRNIQSPLRIQIIIEVWSIEHFLHRSTSELFEFIRWAKSNTKIIKLL